MPQEPAFCSLLSYPKWWLSLIDLGNLYPTDHQRDQMKLNLYKVNEANLPSIDAPIYSRDEQSEVLEEILVALVENAA